LWVAMYTMTSGAGFPCVFASAFNCIVYFLLSFWIGCYWACWVAELKVIGFCWIRAHPTQLNPGAEKFNAMRFCANTFPKVDANYCFLSSMVLEPV
jgi:hypothetical protein